MGYRILRERLMSSLELSVITLIEQGWEPIGGIAVDKYAEHIYFYQAMIFKIKNND